MYYMAGGPGFEPRLTESESAVLPLNYPPTAASSAALRAGAAWSIAKRGARRKRTRRPDANAFAPAAVTSPLKAPDGAPCASHLLHRHHARRGLERARDRGGDRIAAGQADFDLVLRPQHQDQRHLALARRR